MTTPAWETLLVLDGSSRRPRHEQLASAIRAAIRSGRIPTGSALPPSRHLANDLGCSRWVVTQAYAQLIAEGYLEARTGSATRVRWAAAPTRHSRVTPPRQQAAPRIDLAPGLPDLRHFPRRRWAEAVRSVLSTLPHAELGYPPLEGHPRLRETLAAYLRRSRAADVSAHDVWVTTRVTDGVARACRALRSAGVAAIALEDPGWPTVRNAAAAAGLRTVTIPVDEDGLCVSDLARFPEVRAVVVTPAHQFPTGRVLTPDRRAALLAWAREVDGVILEDDYDAEFRYDRSPVATLQGMDPGRVMLLGSLSKTLSPALGIGWLVVPASWTSRIRAASATTPIPPVLDQLAFAHLVETGGYDRHLRAARHRYRARRDALLRALAAALPACEVSGVAAGLHLLLHLPAGTDPIQVAAHARDLGVKVDPLASYQVRVSDSPVLVLGYGNLADTAVEEAVALLARAVHAAGTSR